MPVKITKTKIKYKPFKQKDKHNKRSYKEIQKKNIWLHLYLILSNSN